MGKRLYRSRRDRWISGVCGGVAEYLDVDPVLVRVAAVLLLAVGNVAAVIAYLVMALVVPEGPGAAPGEEVAEMGDRERDLETTPLPESAPPPAEPSPPAPPPAAPGPVPAAERRSGTVGTTVGMVFVLLGVAVMAGRFVGGFPVWTLWPLVVVVIGVVQLLTSGKEGWGLVRLAEGLTTVALGTVLLGWTTGMLGWDVWVRFISLWPLLLVALGAGILGRSLRMSWIQALGSLVVVGAFALAAYGSWTGTASRWWYPISGGEEFSFAETVGIVESGTLSVDAGMGEVVVTDGAMLLSASGRSPLGEPRLSVARTGSSADITLRAPGPDGAVLVGGPAARMDLALSDAVVWREVRIDTGMSSLQADLTDLAVEDLVLNTGMSDTELRLGDVPDDVEEASVLLKAGFASVRIELPADAEVRVTSDSGFAPVEVDARLEKVDGGWQTRGYDSARRAGRGVWTVHVKAGFGAVDVDLR